MRAIFVEGVRCFHDSQDAPLAPITLLVGENSTGKTTFLALCRIIWDLCQVEPSVDFNEEPFQLGTYDQVASFKGGRGGLARSFTLGTRIAIPPHRRRSGNISLPEMATIRGTFQGKGTQPLLVSWNLEAGPYRIEMKAPFDTGQSQITVITPEGTFALVGLEGLPRGVRLHNMMSYVRFLILERFKHNRPPNEAQEGLDPATLAPLGHLIEAIVGALGPRPFAFAPIRSRPRRTYDLLKDVPDPEGGHIPVMLAKVLASDPEVWKTFRQSLTSFGKDAGLFKDLEVRKLGHKESDPFQIRVKISGPAFNLVDVGYGVSQVLPIVIDSLQQRRARTFLLQQPEVHLHPRAQAELASFLASLTTDNSRRFVIETHSDYLVDRFRLEARKASHISPEDVSILYFARQDGDVTISPIRLDTAGNLVGAPDGYRQFFLNEERAVLGLQ